MSEPEMTHSGVCSELLLQTLASLHIALLTSAQLITQIRQRKQGNVEIGEGYKGRKHFLHFTFDVEIIDNLV